MGRYRLRVVFSKRGVLKYISHLDMMRLWERLLRRSEIPLAYSEGFTPHPKISIAAPLPVGFEGHREVMELILTSPLSPEDFIARVRPNLPYGLDIISAEEAPLRGPSLQQRVRASEYRVRVWGLEDCREIAGKIEELLGRPVIIRRKEKKGKVRQYDLRPLIESLRLEGKEDGACVIWMLLQTRSEATARPEEILEELGLEEKEWEVERLAIHFLTNGS